jgi:hypothetical protein
MPLVILQYLYSLQIKGDSNNNKNFRQNCWALKLLYEQTLATVVPNRRICNIESKEDSAPVLCTLGLPNSFTPGRVLFTAPQVYCFVFRSQNNPCVGRSYLAAAIYVDGTGSSCAVFCYQVLTEWVGFLIFFNVTARKEIFQSKQANGNVANACLLITAILLPQRLSCY